MKILVFGPRDRYDVYRPPFADEMPVELVFRRPDQTYVQAAQEMRTRGSFLWMPSRMWVPM